MSSEVLKKTKGQKSQLNLKPSDVTLVCGPREECDPLILKLAEAGFLKIRHTANRGAIAYDDGAGTIVPPRAWIDGIKEHGVLQAVRIMRDGKEYVVTIGRKRIKACAILNYEASAESGERDEKYLFGAVVFTGTEEQAYRAMVIENHHRIDDPPTVRARKLRDGLELYHLDMAVVCGLFNMTEANVRLNLQLLSCVEPLRELVDSGKVGQTLAARELSKLPREEQMPAYEKLAAEGLLNGAGAVEGVKRLRAGKDVSGAEVKGERAVGRAKMLAWAEALAEEAKVDPEVKVFVVALKMACGLSPAGCAKFRKLIESAEG